MRIALSVLFLVLILAVAGALAAPGFVDWNKYKTVAQSQFENMTGHKIALNGDIKVAVIPMPTVSVKNVEITTADGRELAKAKSLEGRVALMPLLKKRIDIVSASLIEPTITLSVSEAGEPVWMNETLEQRLTKKTEQPKENKAISVQSLEIENGSFRFDDLQKKKTVYLENITTEVNADTLKGPFVFDGQVKYGGQDYKFKGKSGTITDGASSIPLNISLEAPETMITFAGVAETAKPYGVQGEVEVNVSSLSKALEAYKIKNVPINAKDIKVSGILTADPEKAELKNGVWYIGDDKLNGDAVIALKPLSINASLRAENTLNLDTILVKSSGGGVAGTSIGKSKDMAHPGQALPEKIGAMIPMPVDISLSAPAVIYKNNQYKNVTARVARDASYLAAQVESKSIPGQGTANIALSAPLNAAKMDVKLDVASQNVNETIKAITGEGVPALKNVRKGALDTKVILSRQSLSLKDGLLKLDDSTMKLALDWPNAGEGKRQNITLDLTADTLDLDKFSDKKSAPPATATDAKASAKTDIRKVAADYNMPLDITFDVGAQTLKTGGKTFKGVRAQGSAFANALKFSNLSVQDYAGLAASVKGSVGDVKALKNIALDISAKSDDIKSSLSGLSIKTQGLPEKLKALNVDANLQGSADSLATSADIKAFGGSFDAKGTIATPLEKPSVKTIALGISHGNAASFMQTFAPTMPHYTSLEKPMNVSMNVQQEGKVYNLSNLNGTIADSSIAGDLSIDTGSEKPAVKGKLRFGSLNLKGGKGGGAQKTSGGSSGKSGRWSTAKIDNAWLSSANVDLDIAATALTYESWNMDQPSMIFKLGGGQLDISSLKANMYGGSINMNGNVSALQGGGLSVKAVPRMENISLEPLVKSFVGTKIINGTGKVNLNADVAASSVSQSALINSLTGSGSMTGTDIVIEGFDLANFTRSIESNVNSGKDVMSLMGTMKSGGNTQFDTMNGAFTISKGIINLTKLDLDGPEAIMSSNGTIDLPAWRINTAHTVKLKQEGGDVPSFTINVNGPLDNPKQGFAQGAINDYLSRKINKKLEKLLEDKVGDKLNNQLGGELGNTINNLLGVPSRTTAPKAPANNNTTTAPSSGGISNDNIQVPAQDKTTTDDAQTPSEPVQQNPAPAEEPKTQTAPAQPTPEEAINSLIESFF